MSTKTQLMQLDTTNIKSNPTKIVPLNHSIVNQSLIDEFFQPAKTEKSSTPTTNTIIGNIKENVDVDITFNKTGNKVSIYGKIRNDGTVGVGTMLFQITNTLYKPRTDISRPVLPCAKYQGTSTLTASHLTTDVDDYIMLMNSSIAAGEYIVFNGSYFVNDN
jgi:hypothetical protein